MLAKLKYSYYTELYFSVHYLDFFIMILYKDFIDELSRVIVSMYPLCRNYLDNYIKFDYNFDSSRILFGDISINSALQIAKIYKTNPNIVAEVIKDKLLQVESILKIEIIKPGFINVFFNDTYYIYYLKKLYKEKVYFTKNVTNNQKYNIEFVSANPTGPLHIGHGRGAIIGDILYQVLKIKGYAVQAEYYINDAGMQIYKLGKSVFLRYKELCTGEKILFDNDLYQGQYIVDVAEKIYQKYGNAKLNENLIWFSDHAKELLLEEIKSTLIEYQINFDVWFSEKELHKNGCIEYAVSLLVEKGYVYTSEEDQSMWFRSTMFGDEKDRVLKKSDGLWTYIAADIAYFLNKIERGFTKIIMVLGQDHHSFKIRLHAIAQALGFPTNNLVILLYQLVSLKNENEVVKMSKRKGNSIELQDIIDNVGSDVARFFYLNRKADAHLDFDISKALEKDKNNPVFYIQYALVRISSLLKKYSGVASSDQICDSITKYNYSFEERLLLKKINTFNNLLNDIIENYQIHQLAFYTLELSSFFHAFYMKHPIISNDPVATQTRIALVSVIGDILSICAKTLGISIPEHM